MRRFIYIFLVVLLSCTRQSIPLSEKLVVEAWIEQGKAPVVFLTTSMIVSETFQGMSDLQSHVVRWGRVSISNGEDEVVLTGVYSKDQYPPYYYTTGRMIGEAGKSYSLKVDYGGVHAEAETTIPPPANLDSLRVVPYNEGKELYMIKAYFNNDPSVENYYGFFTKIEKVDSTFTPSEMSVVDGAQSAQNMSVSLRPGTSISREKHELAFRKGEDVLVSFRTMTRDMYLFWRDMDQQRVMANTSILATDRNLLGNMKGALGYFAGYGSSYYGVHIP